MCLLRHSQSERYGIGVIQEKRLQITLVEETGFSGLKEVYLYNVLTSIVS